MWRGHQGTAAPKNEETRQPQGTAKSVLWTLPALPVTVFFQSSPEGDAALVPLFFFISRFSDLLAVLLKYSTLVCLGRILQYLSEWLK